MNFDGEIPVGCGHEMFFPDASDLFEKKQLLFIGAHMLDHGVGPADVKRAVLERKCCPVIHHGVDLRVSLFESLIAADTESGYLFRKEMMFFQIIVIVAVFVVVSSDIQYGRGLIRVESFGKKSVFSSSVLSAYRVSDLMNNIQSVTSRPMAVRAQS